MHYERPLTEFILAVCCLLKRGNTSCSGWGGGASDGCGLWWQGWCGRPTITLLFLGSLSCLSETLSMHNLDKASYKFLQYDQRIILHASSWNHLTCFYQQVSVRKIDHHAGKPSESQQYVTSRRTAQLFGLCPLHLGLCIDVVTCMHKAALTTPLRWFFQFSWSSMVLLTSLVECTDWGVERVGVTGT